MSSFLTYVLFALLAVLALWFARDLRKPGTIASLMDLVTEPLRGRLSAAKIGQLVGLIVSTWIVIKLTISGTLTYDIFGMYLLYVAGVDLYGKHLRQKGLPPGVSSTKKTETETTTTVKQEPLPPKEGFE